MSGWPPAPPPGKARLTILLELDAVHEHGWEDALRRYFTNQERPEDPAKTTVSVGILIAKRRAGELLTSERLAAGLADVLEDPRPFVENLEWLDELGGSG